MEIGGQIRTLRKKMKISQEKLAKLVGVSSSSISLWEIGKKRPDEQHYQALENIFSVHFQQAQVLGPRFRHRRLSSSEPEPLKVEVRYTSDEFVAEQALNKFSRPFLKYAANLFKDPAVQAEFEKWQEKRAAKEAQAYGQN